MGTEVRILADSLSPQGHRLTTFVLTYARIIHSELMTHRVFSRNSSSSRAETVKHKIERVKENMFMPKRFAKNCKGMSNKEWLSTEPRKERLLKTSEHDDAVECWQQAFEYSHNNCKYLGELDVHKQHANRLLEPFEYITVIVTASEWEGFWEQRAPKYHTPVSGEGYYFKSKKDCIANHSNPINLEKLENFTEEEWHAINTNTAQPEMMELAEMMWDAYNESKPKELKAGEWHLPFGDTLDLERIESIAIVKYDEIAIGDDEVDPNYLWFVEDWIERIKLMIVVSRCARVSYLNHEGKDDYEADIKLYDFLIQQGHMSPLEHACRCQSDDEYKQFTRTTPKGTQLGWCNNVRGWIQHRWEIEN